MTEQRKQLLTIALTLLIAAIIQIAAVYGIVIPAVKGQSDSVSVLSTNQKITTSRDGSTLNVLGGGLLNAAANSTVTFNGNFLMNGTPVIPFATVAPTVTPRPTVTPQPAPTVVPTTSQSYYGSAGSYTSGATISVGSTVTQTFCFSPQFPITTTYTITATGFSADFTTASAITWACGK